MSPCCLPPLRSVPTYRIPDVETTELGGRQWRKVPRGLWCLSLPRCATGVCESGVQFVFQNRLPVDVRPLSAKSCPPSPQYWNAVKQSANTSKRTVSCCTIPVPQASLHSPLCPHSTPYSQPLRLVPNNLTAGSASSTHVARHLLHRSQNTDQAHRAHIARLRTRVRSFVSNTKNGDLCLGSNVTLTACLCLRGCIVVRTQCGGGAELAASY